MWYTRKPLWTLLLLGLLSELFYLLFFTRLFFFPNSYSIPLDIGEITAYQPSTFILLLAVTISLFAMYYLGWRICLKETKGRVLTIILTFALLFGVTLGFMYPVTATDIFGYAFYTRIFTFYHQNPLVTAPIQFQQDPLLYFAGDWSSAPSPYGPLWTLLAAIPSLLGWEDILFNLIYLKALAVLFYWADTALIYLILSKLKPKFVAAGVFLFAWNPLLLFEAPGNGHNDIVMMFFVLFAVYLLVNGRGVLTIVALAGSVLVKYATVLIVPFFLLALLHRKEGMQQRVFFLLQAAVAAALLALPLYLPFWKGVATFLGPASQSDTFTISFPYLFLFALERKMNPAISLVLVKVLVVVLFGLFYIRQASRVGGKPEDVVNVSYETLFFFLLLAWPQFESWYLIWPLSFAALASTPRASERIVLFSLTAMVTLAIFGYLWPWNRARLEDLFITDFLGVVFVFLPPLFLSLPIFLRSRLLTPASAVTTNRG